MRLLSYLMLVLALAPAAALLAGLVWTTARIDWSQEVFTLAFWTKNPEDVRNLVLIVGGGIVAAFGLAFTAYRTHAANVQAKAADEQARVANAQARVAEQGHITDRFTRAIEQLGSDKPEVRPGAVYALERIAEGSRRDHGPIVETLTAYVREKAPWPPAGRPISMGNSGNQATEGEDQTRKAKPATDIQAVLTVIGRRRREYDIEGQRLNLHETDLRGADLHGAHLEGADLRGAHLKGANLAGAYLERADLRGAHLERADLGGVRLRGADLRGAHLKGANLHMADLKGADLRGAQDLTQRQLDLAISAGRGAKVVEI